DRAVEDALVARVVRPCREREDRSRSELRRDLSPPRPAVVGAEDALICGGEARAILNGAGLVEMKPQHAPAYWSDVLPAFAGVGRAIGAAHITVEEDQVGVRR